jgi:hypothetical protein
MIDLRILEAMIAAGHWSFEALDDSSPFSPLGEKGKAHH